MLRYSSIIAISLFIFIRLNVFNILQCYAARLNVFNILQCYVARLNEFNILQCYVARLNGFNILQCYVVKFERQFSALINFSIAKFSQKLI